jgi:uncharacterized membrane protein
VASMTLPKGFGFMLAQPTPALALAGLQLAGLACLSGRRLACLAAAALLLPVAWIWPVGIMAADSLLLYVMALAVPLALFAGSLRRGCEPLVSVLARHVHGGTLRRDVASYTAALTWCWSLFFLLALIAPLALWVVGPPGAWNWPLEGGTAIAALALLLIEYGLRRLVIRDYAHASLRASVAAFYEVQRAR